MLMLEKARKNYNTVCIQIMLTDYNNNQEGAYMPHFFQAVVGFFLLIFAMNENHLRCKDNLCCAHKNKRLEEMLFVK